MNSVERELMLDVDNLDLEVESEAKARGVNLPRVVIILLLIIAVVILIAMFAGSSSSSQAANRISAFQLAFSNAMRQVWQEHVDWTRELIGAIVDRAPLTDLAAVQARLLQNVPDMTKLFARFYPATVIAQMTDLLTTHLTTAAEVVVAARDGNATALADANSRWYANAQQLATFFNKINPDFGTQAQLLSMFNQHLDLTKLEATQRISGQFAQSVQTFNQIQQQALAMADMFTAGLVKQFPKTFEATVFQI
jgi:hypothetical protein